MIETVSSSLRNVVKGTALIFFGMVVSILLWFATKILIIRNCTKEEFGIYSLVVALAGVISIFANLGIQEGITRYVSIFLAEDKNNESKAISRTALRLGALSGATFASLLFFLSGGISKYVFYKPELQPYLEVISFYIPGVVLVNIIIGILRGYNLINPKIFIMDIGQPFFFLILLSISFLKKMPFAGVIYSYTFSIVLVFVLIAGYVRKKGLGLFSVAGDGYKRRELLKFSLPLMMASLLVVVLSWTDTLMLGRYAGNEDVGIYNVSISLARLLVFPVSAMEFAFMAIAGSMYARNEFAELKKHYQVLTKWNFLATLPIFFILFFFPEMTVTYIFGTQFIAASVPLKILAAGFLFHAFLGANGVLILIMGKAKELMNISVVGVLMNIVFNYIFIKLLGYGIIGSAVATVLSYFLLNIMISLVLYQNGGIHPLTSQYLKPIGGLALAGVVIYIIAKMLPLSPWMLPLYLAIFIGGYAITLAVTKSLDKEDILLFEAVVEKIGFEMKWARKLIYKFAVRKQANKS